MYLRVGGEEVQTVVEEFLESAEPFYDIAIWCSGFVLKQSTVDALIDKFVPVDGGNFIFNPQRLNKEELEKLVVKCEMSDKKVCVTVPMNSARSDDLTKLFDFEKYYSKMRISHSAITGIREGAKLAMRAWNPNPNELYFDWVEKDVATSWWSTYH
uniref:FCP1 homology domain-containing protein n=1 Tax=Steinernema glaseri TaxID=37863 RepID=A0A1I7Y1L2_9BILA